MCGPPLQPPKLHSTLGFNILKVHGHMIPSHMKRSHCPNQLLIFIYQPALVECFSFLEFGLCIKPDLVQALISPVVGNGDSL